MHSLPPCAWLGLLCVRLDDLPFCAGLPHAVTVLFDFECRDPLPAGTGAVILGVGGKHHQQSIASLGIRFARAAICVRELCSGSRGHVIGLRRLATPPSRRSGVLLRIGRRSATSRGCSMSLRGVSQGILCAGRGVLTNRIKTRRTGAS